jgi:hypothetical protein
MLFEEIPEWAIAGPVVSNNGAPIFERHKIHKALSDYYRNIDDVLLIESVVRQYVPAYLCSPQETIKKLHLKLI